ncbi:translocase [Gimesia maris DSM 8797]|nr:translocase [Gimesia maris DSM 8797]
MLKAASVDFLTHQTNGFECVEVLVVFNSLLEAV